MTIPLIEARGLGRRFGEVRALRDVDLVAESGVVLAVLGPNGAGKTTFVRMLATLLRPDAGTLRVCGADVVRERGRVRSVIGLAGQAAAVEPAMTGRENLRMVAVLFGLSRRDARVAAADTLDRFGLAEVADRRAGTYSGGQRRRLDLAAGLVGRPRLLLLDEPTTGLDPRSRAQLWDAVGALVEDGTDVVLTTQYLEEADRLAGRLVVLDHGAVIADGSPAELKAAAGHDVIAVGVGRPADLTVLADLAADLGYTGVRTNAGALTVSWPTTDGPAALARLVPELARRAVEVAEIASRRPSLDEVFLQLTGDGGTLVGGPV